MTEAAVAPLDAYATAKPGEPTWTVQGGDPLGAPLLRIWAAFARLMAGIISPGVLDGIFRELCDAANKNPPENERERDALLVRATQTEQVSWKMDKYRKSGFSDQPEVETDTHLDEFARIDLHDLKVRAAQYLTECRGEIAGFREALIKKGFNNTDILGRMEVAEEHLRALNNEIEPRRHFRRTDHYARDPRLSAR